MIELEFSSHDQREIADRATRDVQHEEVRKAWGSLRQISEESLLPDIVEQDVTMPWLAGVPDWGKHSTSAIPFEGRLGPVRVEEVHR